MQMARQWNENHCKPPLDEKEFQKQWRDATNFLKTSFEHFLEGVKPGDSKETRSKRLQKEQIKKEKLKEREYFVDGLIQQMNLKTLKDTDEIYLYEDKRGIFVPGAEPIIKSILEEKFGIF